MRTFRICLRGQEVVDVEVHFGLTALVVVLLVVGMYQKWLLWLIWTLLKHL